MGVGQSKTLEEQIKENKRNINKAIRELDRERKKLERQEKKIEKDIKKAAKENQMEAVKIMAKVRPRGSSFRVFTRACWWCGALTGVSVFACGPGLHSDEELQEQVLQDADTTTGRGIADSDYEVDPGDDNSDEGCHKGTVLSVERVGCMALTQCVGTQAMIRMNQKMNLPQMQVRGGCVVLLLCAATLQLHTRVLIVGGATAPAHHAQVCHGDGAHGHDAGDDGRYH